MEAVFLIVLFILLAPGILAIVALVQVSKINQKLQQLTRKLEGIDSNPTAVPPVPVPKPSSKKPEEIKPPPPPVAARSISTEISKPAKIQNTKSSIPSNGGLEFLMGGKAAAFAGIGILVMGIVFLVGYAIQNSWIGPGTRILAGLSTGCLLIGVGHYAERKSAKYRLLARVLTGGGSALFYFSVFAAHGIYNLIGPIGAGLGLFASALGVFALAMFYRSQSVAVIGVLGAFVTPLLIGGDIEAGIFPLVYVAVINIPVLLLGVKRKWQILYNLAFIWTVIHYLVWLDITQRPELTVGLIFAVVYFLQYAGLGLLKLHSEQKIAGRTADVVRLLFASWLLMGAVYWLLTDANLGYWIGTAFLLLSILHMAFAKFSHRVLRRFNVEILTFVAGATTFATMALPAQLDGVWVSLGWAVEGAVLAWLASRVQSRTLLSFAFILGMTGITKSLIFDVTLYQSAPDIFLNARFVVGLISAGLLGVQGYFAGRFPKDSDAFKTQDLMWWTGILGLIIVCFADSYWTLGTEEDLFWLMTSFMLLITGTSVTLFAPKSSTVTILGSLLILLVPLKLFFFDAFFNGESRSDQTPFSSYIVWIQLMMVVALPLILQPRLTSREARYILPTSSYSALLNVLSLAAGICLVTVEILHHNTDWANTTVTIFWAVTGLCLILFGMKRRVPAHRYFGLSLLALSALKVLLFDSSELNGLERISAFIGTGVLLLVLSFAYQRASAYFDEEEEIVEEV